MIHTAPTRRTQGSFHRLRTAPTPRAPDSASTSTPRQLVSRLTIGTPSDKPTSRHTGARCTARVPSHLGRALSAAPTYTLPLVRWGQSTRAYRPSSIIHRKRSMPCNVQCCASCSPPPASVADTLSSLTTPPTSGVSTCSLFTGPPDTVTRRMGATAWGRGSGLVGVGVEG